MLFQIKDMRGMIFRCSISIALLVLVSGCTFYRHTDYTLRFSNAHTDSPCARGQLEIVFLHELFPFNAPRTIRTNLDAQGAVELRLADHFPTSVFLRTTNSSSPYSWTLDLHSMQREVAASFSRTDKQTGECRLDLTKVRESK